MSPAGAVHLKHSGGMTAEIILCGAQKGPGIWDKQTFL